MNFIALHRGPATAVGTTRPWLDADEALACDSAIDLLERLQALHDRRQAEHEAALVQARDEGYRAGRTAAIEQLAPHWLQAWQAAAAASAVQTEALREAAGVLACRIVHQLASSLAPAEVVAAVARQVLERRLPPAEARIRVHPAVATAVAERLAEAEPTAAPRVRMVADEALGLLDCVVQTALGDCVAGLHLQLERIIAGLRS